MKSLQWPRTRKIARLKYSLLPFRCVSSRFLQTDADIFNATSSINVNARRLLQTSLFALLRAGRLLLFSLLCLGLGNFSIEIHTRWCRFLRTRKLIFVRLKLFCPVINFQFLPRRSSQVRNDSANWLMRTRDKWRNYSSVNHAYRGWRIIFKIKVFPYVRTFNRLMSKKELLKKIC